MTTQSTIPGGWTLLVGEPTKCVVVNGVCTTHHMPQCTGKH